MAETRTTFKSIMMIRGLLALIALLAIVHAFPTVKKEESPNVNGLKELTNTVENVELERNARRSERRPHSSSQQSKNQNQGMDKHTFEF